MNQESSHSEQDSLAADTVETNQSQKNDQASAPPRIKHK